MNPEDVEKMVIKNSETLSRVEQKQDDMVKGQENMVSVFREFKHEIKSEFKDMKDNYVTKKEFNPVQKLVYGVVVLILTTVVSAGLIYIIK